jgi:hypothetical protein
VGIQARGHSWSRWAVLPLLTVVAVAGCASASGSNQPGQAQSKAAQSKAAQSKAARSTPAPSTSAQATTGTGARSVSVSWASVGAGWSLAEYSASTSGGVEPRKTGATLLYLVGPSGYRDALYQWPAGQTPWALLDWSGDKTRALFVGPTPNTVGQLVLATGKFTSFKLPGGTQVLGYSRPDGTAILATQQVMSTDKVLRYDLTGHLEQTLASGPANSASDAVYAPDGTSLAVNGAKALEQVGNDGHVIRSLPVPGNPTCHPVRWWNASTILAGCDASGYAASRLWLVPVSGATPTALTPQRSSSGPDLGDLDAWSLPSGLYLQAAGPCGVIYIATPTSTGAAATVTVPETTGNDNQIVAADGARLLVRAQTSCEAGGSLLWFNPATHAVQMLMRAPAGTPGVIADVPYGHGS